MGKECKVIGLDAFTDYYDIQLKYDRFKILEKNNNFYGYTGFLQNKDLINEICEKYKPDIFIHLAAQAGVRYSLKNPETYVESNILGTFSLLEIAKTYNPKHLLIASTSSVYGNNKRMPFSENDKSDTPISFYAATKKSIEVIAHSYSHLYQIPTTIFRFFTVYGPWGRPDMALFKFTKNILSEKPIDIYNHGRMSRDFTNIHDLVEAITLLSDIKPLEPFKRKFDIQNDSISDTAPFRIINIGNSKPIELLEFIKELEEALGVVAKKNFLEIQDGDLLETFSDMKLLKSLTGFVPKTTLKNGISEFVRWYKWYYSHKSY